MSFYPDTDRASTWVALVMIGFMGVSVFVWVWGGRSPVEDAQPQQQTTTSAQATAPQQPAPAAQKTEQAQPALPPTMPFPGVHAASLSTQHVERPLTEIDIPARPSQAQASTSGATAQAQAANTSAPAIVAQPRHDSQTTASAPTPAPAQVVSPPPMQAQAVEQPSGPSASALVRGLRAGGHRVHAAVSGDMRSTTLSVTGLTLTRDIALEWLGGARPELKAAGIRVVVVNNGQASWTFML